MDARSAKALSKDDWAKMAGDADSIFEGRCFINGEYVDAADGGKIEVINPATNEACLVGCRIDDLYLSAICCINIFTINETSSFEDTIGIARHLGPIIFRQCFCASRIHSFLLVFIYFC